MEDSYAQQGQIDYNLHHTVEGAVSDEMSLFLVQGRENIQLLFETRACVKKSKEAIKLCAKQWQTHLYICDDIGWYSY